MLSLWASDKHLHALIQKYPATSIFPSAAIFVIFKLISSFSYNIASGHRMHRVILNTQNIVPDSFMFTINLFISSRIKQSSAIGNSLGAGALKHKLIGHLSLKG
jgi:hypothetical protein